MSAAAMVVAIATEGAFGWPDRLFRAIGHPVTWMGKLISNLDRRFNLPEDAPEERRFWGRIAVMILLASTLVPTIFATILLPDGLLGLFLTGLLAAPLVAPRSMYTHVADVAKPLKNRDIPAARTAVAKIVGRNPNNLDKPAITRAAIESLAENTSDGIVAPVFWGALFGLPGIAAYKAVNTADSMIGHKSDKHLDFGRAAARLDDVMNWLPARLTALGICFVQPNVLRAIKITFRDASEHRSPNAGWPEAAMAGALGVRLSGPRQYAEGPSNDPFLNDGAPDPTPDNLGDALTLFLRVMALLIFVLVVLAIL